MATADYDDESIEYKRALIDPAAMLYGVQKMFGEQARVKAKQAYGQLIDAHLLVAGVLGARIAAYQRRGDTSYCHVGRAQRTLRRICHRAERLRERY